MTLILEGQHLDIRDEDVLSFKHVKQLGVGGNAIVETAQLTTDGRQFAHKIFRRSYNQKPGRVKQSFRNEVKIIKRLSPRIHIIRLFATYTCGRTPDMLLTPVTNNGDLATYLQAILDSENPPTIEQMVILESAFGCLTNGLAFIYKHTIRHKDIKP